MEAGAYYVMDRGYIDFTRLFRIHGAKAFFVTRSRKDIRWHRLYSNPVDKQKGIRCDQTIRLSTHDGRKHYPEKFRRIKYFDAGTKRTYVFFTNDFSSSAMTIAELYKNRWQVELFFQMDQATPKHQGVLGTLFECGEDTNLHRALRISSRCDHEKETEN